LERHADPAVLKGVHEHAPEKGLLENPRSQRHADRQQFQPRGLEQIGPHGWQARAAQDERHRDGEGEQPSRRGAQPTRCEPQEFEKSPRIRQAVERHPGALGEEESAEYQGGLDCRCAFGWHDHNARL